MPHRPTSAPSSSAAPSEDAAPQPLVSTKLVPPRGVGKLVPREALIAQLLEARRRRCFVIQGPGGCGKTTTLVAWRQALLPLGFDVAWLTLTREDDELTRALDYLIASLAQVDPAITREAAELAGRGTDSEAVERTIVALVRGIARHPRDLVLVLDDLQNLGDAGIQEALQWLLDYSPPNLHVVVASRSAVPLSLARLRAQGLVLELDLRDLRFSPAESARFLQNQLGAIEPRDALLLHELTDGWVAGLQLLAIDWKKRRQQAGAEAGAPGDFMRAHVRDAQAFSAYFEREVLSRLSPSELDLLISLSACSRFCAPLCAALVGPPATVSEAAALLGRLEADNLFIVPVESTERETWYRLHPLLRETLRERLSRRSEARRRRVHLAAWHWFRDRGLLDEAVRQGVEAGEADAAADLVERSANAFAIRGELRKLIGLVRQLPPEQVQARVRLRLWMVRVELYGRDHARCAATIVKLRGDIPADDLASRFTLTMLEGSLAVQRDDTDAAMAALPRMLEPPGDADALSIGGRDNILSWLYMHRGEYERARQVQQDNPERLINGVPLLGTASGILQGRCLVGLSYALEGRMNLAERAYREVIHEAGQHGNSCIDPAYLATSLLGEVLYESGDTEAVLRLVEDRIDVLERVSIPDSVLRVLLMLANSHWVAGRRLESFAYLERLEDYATDLGLDRLLAHSLATQVYRLLLTGDHAGAEAVLQRLESLAARHAQAERSALGEVPMVMQRTRIRWHLAREEFDAAVQCLEPLLAQAEARSRQRLVVNLLMLRAVIERRRGRHDAAHAVALDALRRGHRLGLVRSLLDAAPNVVALIEEVGSEPGLDPVLAFYVERLLGVARQSAAPAGDAVGASATVARSAARLPIEALSERELEVVQLLAQALPNKKIARTLGLSPETVKWHLKNIYGKLGVSGRDEAVARVRDLTV